MALRAKLCGAVVGPRRREGHREVLGDVSVRLEYVEIPMCSEGKARVDLKNGP